MHDLISRQAAIDTSLEFFVEFLGGAFHENAQKELIARIQRLQSAQPEQTDCEYCHEDSDGYVKPIEKNCHAFIRFGMNGWEISLSAKGWSGSVKIIHCPMCGRELRNDK